MHSVILLTDSLPSNCQASVTGGFTCFQVDGRLDGDDYSVGVGVSLHLHYRSLCVVAPIIR